jgi:hypothetical protein
MNAVAKKMPGMLLLLAITVFMPFLFISCEQGPETITYLTDTDTVRVKDTLRIKDTVINFDTLHDTAWIPIGSVPRFQVFGMLYDGLPGESDFDYDSIYGYCSISSKPLMREVVATYGNHRLEYTKNQSMLSFFEGYNYNPRIFPSLTTAQYEQYFRDTSSALACTLKVPYYVSDSAVSPKFDTIVEQTSFPKVLDTLFFFDEQGKPYDSVHYTYFVKNIKLDENLKVVWENIKARWYAVECIRYNVYKRGAVGLLDTFCTDTQIVIPHDFFYQDELTDGTKQYDALIVAVLPVNGPPPTTWDSCSSFGGNGHLFALHYDNIMIPLNASWREPYTPSGLGKKAGPLQPILKNAPRGAVMRMFGKSRK